MFGLKTLGKSTTHIINWLLPVSTSTETKQSPKTLKESAYVHVWKLTAAGVGHAALQIGEGEDAAYASIHPNFIPAIGPTMVLPLPALLAEGIEDDMASEAAARNSDPCTDSMNGVASNTSNATAKLERLPPDYSIKVDGLDTGAMRTAFESIKNEVAEGEISYQLVPKINVLGFFKALPGYIAQDPVDIAMMRRAEATHPPSKVHNCATLVAHLLQVGGAPEMKTSHLPWTPTPNDIAAYAEQASNPTI